MWVCVVCVCGCVGVGECGCVGVTLEGGVYSGEGSEWVCVCVRVTGGHGPF